MAFAVGRFVNVDSTDYENVFTVSPGPGASPVVRMSWFASRTQSVQSPVIARLLTSGDLTKRAAMRVNVLLFTRLLGQPYVYCGPLEYFSHDPTSSPLKFLWTLRDSVGLLQSFHFEQVLAAQPDQSKVSIPAAPPQRKQGHGGPRPKAGPTAGGTVPAPAVGPGPTAAKVTPPAAVTGGGGGAAPGGGSSVLAAPVGTAPAPATAAAPGKEVVTDAPKDATAGRRGGRRGNA